MKGNKTLEERNATFSWHPIIKKLLKLKYRINEAYRSGKYDNAYNDTKVDKHWVMNLITDVRAQGWTKLSKEDMLKCNSIWSKYGV